MARSIRSAAAAVLSDAHPKAMNSVWARYASDLGKTEALLFKAAASEVPVINQITQYVLGSGGKRIRPLLLIISAQFAGHDQEDHVSLAAVVELIHSATLLHDDVIDQGDLRRGKKAVRAIWGNHASVLVGDYLYSQAMAQGLRLGRQAINDLLFDACCRMIEGEMIQHDNHGNLDLAEEAYLEIIKKKTASLISSTCELGAMIGSNSELVRRALREYGRYLGMAFQVADDTLDYVAEAGRLGKALGKDLQEGKITLPLLHAIRRGSDQERREIQQIVERGAPGENDLVKILALMDRHGSVQYAMGVAQGFVAEAKTWLAPFEDSPHKGALSVVADYVITRDH